MAGNADWSMLRRVGFAAKFGIVPVGITGAIADIGAPFELWIVPVFASAAAFLVWLLLFYLPALRRRLEKILADSEGISGAYSEPFVLSAASVALMLACLTGVAVSWLSFSQREGGGFLGSNLAMAKEIQKVTGIVEAQGKTLRGIQGNTERAAVILETGEAIEPRVTLGNLGIQWSLDSFREAAKLGDARVIDLFLRGGMSAEDIFVYTSDFLEFLKNSNPEALARLSKESIVLKPPICGPTRWSWDHNPSGALKKAGSREFYARVCNNETTRQRLAEKIASLKRSAEEPKNKYSSTDDPDPSIEEYEAVLELMD